ncbi:hypothetical protein DQM68_16525 [Leptospira mayottensis]|uniref:Uncharacterized protein n=2 Tax=Leptospira mayottensis TaxID=1137606 RepID=A0AA87SXY2_9LEPT|nr:hypothetical protein DQM68_16420 [Leptospira mayottensis]AZQ01511.1 hypothetical protein LEP1GSC190_05180 [Leptospira mayottensis 200901116]EKR98743.1 hypothetical protein LEP1GSC125_0048 [Leptospira mayottensis 200901122]AXR62037.1 hypothetical protein DQM68_16525 [Leptospira mayottensis]AXR62897.1 hypothetical protein DQM28_00075 [Leptospira mayottensis]
MPQGLRRQKRDSENPNSEKCFPNKRPLSLLVVKSKFYPNSIRAATSIACLSFSMKLKTMLVNASVFSTLELFPDNRF